MFAETSAFQTSTNGPKVRKYRQKELDQIRASYLKCAWQDDCKRDATECSRSTARQSPRTMNRYQQILDEKIGERYVSYDYQIGYPVVYPKFP